MLYSYRIATRNDKNQVARLWEEFSQERSLSDPTLIATQNFNYERYVENLLAEHSSYCFLLETEGEAVGFLFTYAYDEAPRPNLPSELIIEKPFKPRRVGSVLGFYVQEQHRHIVPIKLLLDAALAKARELSLTVIDLSIDVEASGIQALLKSLGFTKARVQYVKHLDAKGDLPSLYR